MSIATQIAALTADRNDIRSALARVGVDASNHGFDSFAADIASVSTASSDIPAMDGTASAGSSNSWARGDHVHPTDTSRAAVADLPYAVAQPSQLSQWSYEFATGLPASFTASWAGGTWTFVNSDNSDGVQVQGSAMAEELTFSAHDAGGTLATVTAYSSGVGLMLVDRASNVISDNAATVYMQLPLKVAGKARDLAVYLTSTATLESGQALSLVLVDPSYYPTAIDVGADSLADVAPGRNVILLSEIDNGRWLVTVRHEDVEAES